ncbi:MAG TPA: GNAT family N-acetyltransferase [Anaerolineaceae bacterium]|nr:GNAT family N-acetyltransferase [Anaerolineaceae bacterium]
MTHNDPVTIRIATAGDNVRLAEFGAQAFADSFAADNRPEDMAAYLAESFSPEKQAAELAAPNSVFLIAEIGGEMAGFARLLEDPAPAGVTGRRPLELVRIYAGKQWIGRGVGAALMQACLVEAARRGCDTLWLGVWEHNLRAQAFYRKWGFTVAGTQPFRLGADLQTDLVMQRPVDAPEPGRTP